MDGKSQVKILVIIIAGISALNIICFFLSAVAKVWRMMVMGG